MAVEFYSVDQACDGFYTWENTCDSCWEEICEGQKTHLRCCVVGSGNRLSFFFRPALGVERLDNVRFAEVDGQLFLDLYLPESSGPELVVYIHVGAGR